MKGLIPKVALAWSILIVIPASLALIFIPKLTAYQSNSAASEATRAQISRLESMMRSPVPPKASVRYRSLVLQTENDSVAVENELRQSALIAAESVQASLVEISTSHSPSRPGSLAEINCHVILDGDIRHMTEFMAAMGAQALPILIETISISATSSIGEPERSLRAEFLLTLRTQRRGPS